MKKTDLFVLLGVILLLSPFFVFKPVYEYYETFNSHYPLVMAFVKFSILATFGEMLGLRIKSGKYNMPEFGIVPRALIWGFLGMWIAFSMGVYKIGVIGYLDRFELFQGIAAAMGSELSGMKLCGAFFISLVMNTTFAPVFMTLHKITDTHILQTGGSLKGFFKPVRFTEIIASLNWKVQWGFVFKKTIPFFWIPAHTITFILPGNFQVLFAALLGVALGLILSIASLKGNNGK